MAASQEIVVRNKVGLHARPAAMFVKAAVGFRSRITVENLTKGTQPSNAKSILSVLSAAVQKNDNIRIVAEGEDESEALDALVTLVETNFGETE